jgi:two-component system, LytTR family, sensor kinase
MNRRISLHLAFWLAYWFIYAYTYSRYDGNLLRYLLTEGLQMPARIASTYAVIWCFERFGDASRQRYWLAFAGAAMTVLAGGLLNRLLKTLYLVPVYFPDSTIEFWSHRMMYDLFDVLVAACTALSARLYFRQQALLQREAILRSEKLDAELLALKSQIHPHFLFNTINNLYALARKKSDNTAPVALKLAHLLRYVLYESAKPTVQLEQEIQLIQDYIALEKLRFDTDRLVVSFEYQTDNPVQAITPLLLLPLVENAFKHGVSEHRLNAWINISIQLKSGVLQVKVQNSMAESLENNGQGIGLKNLKRQLELLYPERHRLQQSATGAVFTTNLELHL